MRCGVAIGHFETCFVLFLWILFLPLLSPAAASAALSIALAFGVHLATLVYRSVSAYLRFVFIFRRCFYFAFFFCFAFFFWLFAAQCMLVLFWGYSKYFRLLLVVWPGVRACHQSDL